MTETEPEPEIIEHEKEIIEHEKWHILLKKITFELTLLQIKSYIVNFIFFSNILSENKLELEIPGGK